MDSTLRIKRIQSETSNPKRRIGQQSNQEEQIEQESNPEGPIETSFTTYNKILAIRDSSKK